MMVEQNILDEIKKKSQEIMSSNEELATRLRKNQEVIEKFSDELEELAEEDAGFKPSTKEHLEKLKSDLEEKRKLVTALIDNLKPVELDIYRREGTINALQQRIDDQAKKIESLSQDVVDSKKQVQAFRDDNLELKKQIAENEGIIRVTKNKLTEKVSLLKNTGDKDKEIEEYKKKITEMEDKIKEVKKQVSSKEEQNQELLDEMESLKQKFESKESDIAEKESLVKEVEEKSREVEEHKKKIFELRNKISAVEKRVFSTDDQNQKILYELMKAKERLKSAEKELAEKDSLLESNKIRHSADLEALRKVEEEKKAMIMKSHAKRIAVMNAAVASLKTKLEQQARLITDKAVKERALMSDFNRRMRELLSAMPQFSAEELPSEGSFMEQTPSVEEEPAEESPTYSIEEPTEAPAEPEESEPGPSRIDEIIPMIELATDHGDDTETIKHSLLSSGYSQKDVNDAFSRLNIIQ
jgi:chromosome segregation ATPase